MSGETGRSSRPVRRRQSSIPFQEERHRLDIERAWGKTALELCQDMATGLEGEILAADLDYAGRKELERARNTAVPEHDQGSQQEQHAGIRGGAWTGSKGSDGGCRKRAAADGWNTAGTRTRARAPDGAQEETAG